MLVVGLSFECVCLILQLPKARCLDASGKGYVETWARVNGMRFPPKTAFLMQLHFKGILLVSTMLTFQY